MSIFTLYCESCVHIRAHRITHNVINSLNSEVANVVFIYVPTEMHFVANVVFICGLMEIHRIA